MRSSSEEDFHSEVDITVFSKNFEKMSVLEGWVL